jgi:hypothetical protein
MKKISGLCLFMLFSLCAGCRNGSAGPAGKPAPEWGGMSDGWRIAIAAEQSRFQAAEPAFVSFVVENTEKDARAILAIPAFNFGDMDYWCPVDLLNDGAGLPANARVKIALEGGASIRGTVDISRLRCAEGVSSIWPDRLLYSVVPAGGYTLRMDIEALDGSRELRISSNQVFVEIVK